MGADPEPFSHDGSRDGSAGGTRLARSSSGVCGPPLEDEAEDEGSVVKDGMGWRLAFASDPDCTPLFCPPLRDRLRKKPERAFVGLGPGASGFGPGAGLAWSALLECEFDGVSLRIEEPASDLLERFGTKRAVRRRMVRVEERREDAVKIFGAC